MKDSIAFILLIIAIVLSGAFLIDRQLQREHEKEMAKMPPSSSLKEIHTTYKRDYEISLTTDSVFVYDDDRLVGADTLHGRAVESIIFDDNK